MSVRRAIAVAIALLLASLAAADVVSPFDNLQPQPKRVVAADGVCGNPASVSFLRGAIDGVREDLAGEAYELVIAPDGVTIRASDLRGERYARTTLAQLAKLADGKLPCGTIVDWPQYRWRGIMHDCGRNYLDVASIKKLLDLMAAYKYNLFHWHLTDYHGWRLESKKYPMLQAPWAFRRQLMKFYTQAEFREILDYAAARGITVMPEFDVPGHSLAFRRGLGIARMDDPKVQGIVCDLIDELCSLASPDEMPFVHIGTDEVHTPEEKAAATFCPAVAERVRRNGRIPVGWHPGEGITASDGTKSVRMLWQESYLPDDDECVFDATRLYFGHRDCMDMINAAAFLKPFRFAHDERLNLGVVACSWHDDMIGDNPAALFRNNIFAPAVVMHSSLMWERRDADRPEYRVKLPKPGTEDFAALRKFEDRIVAHRDKVLRDFDMPFAFVRQTDFRWRVSDAEGRVVAEDVAQGTVCLHHWCDDDQDMANSFVEGKTGTATLETWIRSDSPRTIGVWVGFTHYSRSASRGRGLPEDGEWDAPSKGVRVEVNGRVVPPPKWARPGLKYIAVHPEIPYSNNIVELPFAGEEYWMREPMQVSLDAGWNHVRIVVPHTAKKYRYEWVSTFVPVEGTSDHPHEAAGLEYSSRPPEGLPRAAGQVAPSASASRILPRL